MKLQFTLRDLLWLTVVFALAAGWWVDRRHIANIERDQWIENACRLSRFIESKGHGTVICTSDGDIMIGHDAMARLPRP